MPARFQILISRYDQSSRGRAKQGCDFLDRTLCPGTSEAMFGIKRSREDEAIRRSPWSQNLDRKNESAFGVRQKCRTAFWAADDLPGSRDGYTNA
jgi:hypothetical protein